MIRFKKAWNSSPLVAILTGVSLIAAACGSATSTTTSIVTTTSEAVPTTIEIPATTTTIKEQCLEGPQSLRHTCYEVGEMGPGGGTVFFVSPDGFSATTCNPLCHFLEFAPSEIETSQEWCDDGRRFIGNVTGIGGGFSNTEMHKPFCSSGAIFEAANYVSPNETADWFLPNSLELNELCKFARTQPTGDTGVQCAVTGYLQVGFSNTYYWSSDEAEYQILYSPREVHGARPQDFENGYNQSNARKTSKMQVRAIRMF